MQGREAAKEAVRKRQTGVKSSKTGGKGGAGDIKFFSEEAPGLKIQPKSVLGATSGSGENTLLAGDSQTVPPP